ncbi:MAG: hypothetical protein Tsb0020_11720 [Haliangiales bacterium]
MVKADIGDEHLEPLAGLDKLEYLDVSKINVTDKGSSGCRSGCPTCASVSSGASADKPELALTARASAPADSDATPAREPLRALVSS